MKKAIALLLIVSIMSVFSLNAFAAWWPDYDTGKMFGEVARCSWLNVRTGAGTSYSIVTSIPVGTAVEATKFTQLQDISCWCYIDYGGWVNQYYIETWS